MSGAAVVVSPDVSPSDSERSLKTRELMFDVDAT